MLQIKHLNFAHDAKMCIKCPASDRYTILYCCLPKKLENLLELILLFCFVKVVNKYNKKHLSLHDCPSIIHRLKIKIQLI